MDYIYDAADILFRTDGQTNKAILGVELDIEISIVGAIKWWG